MKILKTILLSFLIAFLAVVSILPFLRTNKDMPNSPAMASVTVSGMDSRKLTVIRGENAEYVALHENGGGGRASWEYPVYDIGQDIKFILKSSENSGIDIILSCLNERAVDFDKFYINDSAVIDKSLIVRHDKSVKIFYHLEADKEYVFSINAKKHAVGFFELIAYGRIVNYFILFSVIAFLIVFICDRLPKKDFLYYGVSFFKNIPKEYSRSFIVFFISVNVLYMLFSTAFIWGDHDSQALTAMKNVGGFSMEGRLGTWMLHWAFGYNMLPLLQNIFALTGFALSTVMILRYWNVFSKSRYIVFTGLFLLTTPYALPWIRFTYTMPGNFWTVFLSVTAMYLCDKIFCSSTVRRKLLLFFSSVLLFFISFQIYQLVVSTVAIIFIGKIFFDVMEGKQFKDTLALLFRKHIYCIVSLICSGLLEILFLKFLLFIGIYNSGYYNSQPTELSALPGKAMDQLPKAFESLFTTVPFVPGELKVWLLAVCLSAGAGIIIYCAKRNDYIKIPFLIVLAILGLWFTRLIQIIAMYGSDNIRQVFYGLPFFYLFMFAAAIKLSSGFFRNFIYIVGAVALFLNICNVFTAQRIWQQGFDGEMRSRTLLVENILNNDNYTGGKVYKYLQIGDISNKMWNIFNGLYEVYNEEKERYIGYDRYEDILIGNFAACWEYANVLNYMAPVDLAMKTTKFCNDTGAMREFINSLNNPDIEDFIMNEARVWPDKRSVFISGDTLITVLSEFHLGALRYEMNNK